MKWTKEQARNFIVNYHFINTNNTPSIFDVFSRLKTIQMDPLNVVGINPELVLQSRIRDYKLGDINHHLYQTRYLIDGWEKQMSIYETKYFSYFHRVRENRAEGHKKGALKYYNFDISDVIPEVRKVIQNKYPILSKDISFGEKQSNRWGSSKASTLAIDYLFHKGEIGIHNRKNTQKRYAPVETLIKDHIKDDPFQTEEEFIIWYLKRRIDTCGLAWSKSVMHFQGLHISNKITRKPYLKLLEKTGQITTITIEDIPGEFYIPTAALQIPIEINDNISFIAPLDNLTWDRDLLLYLFDYDYKWEVYTPVSKRRWGYYVLPILKGSKFIGRIEFHKQRKQEPLRVLNLLLEENIRYTKKLDKEINQALKNFTKYLNTKEYIYETKT